MKTVALAPCKVNFTLEVLGTRPDGYHALRSLVVGVSLADTITLEPAASTTCTMSWAGGATPAQVPDPEKNLAVKAVRLLQSLSGVKNEVAIAIEKHIPAGGGLGGGSADAAAVLNALNDMWHCGFSRAELAAYSSAVGSDVPALVLGGAVLMEGRGERVSPFPAPRSPFPVVLANPGVASSTPAVFKNCSISRLPEAGKILYNIRQAISSGDACKVAFALQNDLCDAAVRLYPAIGKCLASLAQHAKRPAMMSGSGASVFTLADSERQAAEIAQAMRAEGYQAWSAYTCPVM